MEESKALEVVQAPAMVTHDFMPVMSIDAAIELRENIVKFVAKIMQKNQDYGVIPGTNSKPVLLKPGAEKLCSFFGLEPEFTVLNEEADWTGERHNGEPFYYIRYHCRLTRNGVTRGVGEGSCNSWESKYRYRQANRKCPACGNETIIKGKEEYGGGWLCFAKKGGCGAKFGDKDKAIVEQQVGRVPNPDVADQVNTIQKMAQKRALVPATLLATSGSEFFTQDLEDAPEPADVQRNTPEQQKELAERRIRETQVMPAVAADGAQPNRGAAEQQPVGSTLIPKPLEVIVRNMEQGKAGAVRAAFDFLIAYLVQVSPERGLIEYQRIRDKHQLAAGTTVKQCIPALIEMYETGEFLREAQIDNMAKPEVTDADLPSDLFGSAGVTEGANN